MEAARSVEAELENRHARERRDPHALRFVELDAARGLEVLLVQEQQSERAQPLAAARRATRASTGVAATRRPKRVGNRTPRKDAPPAPTLEHAVNDRTRRPNDRVSSPPRSSFACA